jgi:hypothetical protein
MHTTVRSSISSLHTQWVGIGQALRAVPFQPGTLVLDSSANFSPEKRIPLSILKQLSVERQVRKELEEVFSASVERYST